MRPAVRRRAGVGRGGVPLSGPGGGCAPGRPGRHRPAGGARRTRRHRGGQRAGQVHAAASDIAPGRPASGTRAFRWLRRARLRAGGLAPAHCLAVPGRARFPGHLAHQSADRGPAGRRCGPVGRVGRGQAGRFRARPARRAGYLGGRDRFATVGGPGAPSVPGAGAAVAGGGHRAGRTDGWPGRRGASRLLQRPATRGAGTHRGAGDACGITPRRGRSLL
ncbi:hypothetical protein G6F31_018188 [Rhizopus arrhizus]|nr:hypothetical protein G6F31_018188 [Rhizopus arrhizus]